MNDKKQNEIEDLSFLVANAIINNSTAEETAEYLYKHNYRKQSETVKEFAEKALAEPTTAEKLLWLAENVFQINIINNGCSIEIRPNNACEKARYFIGIDAAYDWSKEQEK